MATHSSILAWRVPWSGEPGGLQSIGSQRVGHDRVQMHARVSGGVLILRSFSVLASGGFVAALPMISNSSNLPFGAQRRSWMLAYKKWGTKMPPCPGASQDPAWHLNQHQGTSLAVQWLRLHPSNLGGSIPGQGAKIPHASQPEPTPSKASLLTLGCGEGTHRVSCRMPSKENRQLVLKRSELPSGFQGSILKGNISVTWKLGFTSCWMSSQKTQPSQRLEEGRVYCHMQQIRRTLGILSKTVFLLNSIIGEVLS